MIAEFWLVFALIGGHEIVLDRYESVEACQAAVEAGFSWARQAEVVWCAPAEEHSLDRHIKDVNGLPVGF